MITDEHFHLESLEKFTKDLASAGDRRQLFLPVCVYYSCRLTSC